jgi:Baseplate J-like protein
MTTPPPSRDRRQLLLEPGAQFNGIDYVDVAASQTQLFAHFLNTVQVQGTLAATSPVTITGGEVITAVAVGPIDDSAGSADWSADSEGRPVLAVTVTAAGDFSTYQLTIASTALDPFFDSAPFSFKANCPTTLDCAGAATSCPEPATEQVPIDYLAKDFGSFRQALSEFSAMRYPAWVERSEADLGVVLMEALSAMADELSYYQDRVRAESTIVTATQRLSAVRHARLVDYEPAPATAATTVLQLDVTTAPPPPPATSWTISTPLLCYALGADGSVIYFETEDPAVGIAGPVSFAVDARWNRGALAPYYWDDSQRCLPAGSTSLYLIGQDYQLTKGQQLLLDSPAADSADPSVRELVEVCSLAYPQDQLLGYQLTQVFLAAPTTQDHDLDSTVVAGNIVPAVQGLRQSDPPFTLPDPGSPPPGPVVVRVGANSPTGNPQPDFRYCLMSGPLAWLATTAQDEDTAVPAQPEIVLSGTLPAAAGSAPPAPSPWTYTRSLLDAGPPGPPAQAYTLTPELYSPVLTSNGVTWYDYDGDGGTTIRFGDGTFGASPTPGAVFTVTYRVGGGLVGNVPAGTIVNIAPGQGSMVTACTNPFPAAGGADGETLEQVRTRAPQMFSAQPLRAVQAADYATAAQSLPWVQQAGTTFRWTGSWLTVLTSADPAGSEEPMIDQLESLTGLLDQQRLAGYESYVLPPSYVSVDLEITVCGQPAAFASDVQAAVLARLQPGPLPGGAAGFFDHSQWGFGQALESSALLAAIQSCPGVVGVYQLQYRERGVQLDWAPLPDTLAVAANEILRVDNDPSRPEAGSVRVTVEGSK